MSDSPISSLNNAPGTVIFTGDRKLEKVQIHHLQFNEHEATDIELSNHQEIENL